MTNKSSMSVRFAGRLGGLRRNSRKGFGSMSPDRLREIARAGALRRWSLFREHSSSKSSTPSGDDLLAGAGLALSPVKADLSHPACFGFPS